MDINWVVQMVEMMADCLVDETVGLMVYSLVDVKVLMLVK